MALKQIAKVYDRCGCLHTLSDKDNDSNDQGGLRSGSCLTRTNDKKNSSKEGHYPHSKSFEKPTVRFNDIVRKLKPWPTMHISMDSGRHGHIQVGLGSIPR